MPTVSLRDERDDSDRENLRERVRRLRKRALIVFILAVALVLYQVLRVEAEISSAETNFKSMIAEYHSQGEKTFRQHLTTALRHDRFFIEPADLKVIEKTGGVVQFSLKYTKKYWILVFPRSREVTFERETLSTAS